MKLAIHDRADSFSDRWIPYCLENQVEYKLVNCYASDIITQLEDCDGLMWHWDQNDYKAALFARQLTFSLAKKGMSVYPDVNTCWHYDDKVGQKYLLEAVDAPLVKSYVFYSRQEALSWLDKTNFPKVFKLRGGAGSENVRLARTKEKARQLVEQAFGKGFAHTNWISRTKDRVRKLKRDKNLAAVRGVISGVARTVFPIEGDQFFPDDKGYIYFQDFIPENSYDTRLIVIGNRCFGLRRYCRKDDFRASGSGILSYEPELIDKRSVQIAFDTAKSVKAQSLALDFILDNHEPKIVEISYCFPMGPFADNCRGYWDSNLTWHPEKINPQHFIIEDFIDSITLSESST